MDIYPEVEVAHILNEVHGKLKFLKHDSSSIIMMISIWMRLDAGWIQWIEIDQRKPLWKDSYGEMELDFHMGN